MKKVMCLIIAAAAVCCGGIVDGPFLQPTDDLETSICIAWSTDNAAQGAVEYGINSVNEIIMETSDSKSRHHLVITGLKPGTKYMYRLTAQGQTSETYSFQTSSKDARFKLMVLADVHIQDSRHSDWVKRVEPAFPDMKAFEPHVILLPGDILEDGDSQEQWKNLFSYFRDLFASAIVIPVAGNHEWTRDTDFSIWKSKWFVPDNGPPGFYARYYSVDYCGVHFQVGGQTGEIEKNPLVRSWIEKDFADAADSKFKVGSRHYQYFVKTADKNNVTFTGWRAILGEIYQKTGVDLEFNGHRHVYQRTYPLVYSGSGSSNPVVGSNNQDSYNGNLEGTIFHEIPSLWFRGKAPVSHPIFAVTASSESGDLGWVQVTVEGSVWSEEVYEFNYKKPSYKKNLVDQFVITKHGSSRKVYGSIKAAGSSNIQRSPYPCPAKHSIWVPFTLQSAGDVAMDIYDITGRRISHLTANNLSKGDYLTMGRALSWDCTNRFGIKVSPGKYLYRLKHSEHNASGYMVISP